MIRYVFVLLCKLYHFRGRIDPDDVHGYLFEGNSRQACPASHVECRAKRLIDIQERLNSADDYRMDIGSCSLVPLGSTLVIKVAWHQSGNPVVVHLPLHRQIRRTER